MGSSAETLESHHHVLLFPFMSKGHTIPLLQFARFLLRRRLAVSVFTTPANLPFVARSLAGTEAFVVDIPFPQGVPDVPAGVESTDQLPSMSLFYSFALATAAMQPDFERRLESLPPVSFMVTDGFLWWTSESAAKFRIPRLVFYGMSNYAMTLNTVVGVNGLVHGQQPADEPFPVTDFSWIKLTKNDFDPSFVNAPPGAPIMELITKTVDATAKSYGYVSNSFYELEPQFVDYWNTRFGPKSWCVGPFCLVDQPEFETKPWWIQWLDQKRDCGRPVLYVAFGSQAELKPEQLRELATGLEKSEADFLWVMRKAEPEMAEALEEKVRGKGVVVREWVEQRVILEHAAVEGFLSHCGMNSMLESICAAVPILAWPMMAEQHLNARFVTEELGVGLRVETSDGSVRGFVKWEGLAKPVKELMQGDKGKDARNKVKQVAAMAHNAVGEGGSSTRALDALITELCKTDA